VVLPYADYLKMKAEWEAARKKPANTSEAVLLQADYTATIEKDFARVQLALQVEVHATSTGWAAVPVKFGDAAIGEVRGDDVLLQGRSPGEYELLFSKPGRQTVQLELAARVRRSPEGRQFSLGVPLVGLQTVDVTVPEADQTIEIAQAGRTLASDPAQPGTTRLKTQLKGTDTLTVSWKSRSTVKPQMDLLASVHNQTIVTIGDGLIHTDARLVYEILRGQLSQVQITVPKTHQILDITANTRLKSWKAEPGEQHQIVEIELQAETESNLILEVHTQRKETGVPFEVCGLNPETETWGIHALDAVRESGQLVIRHAADLSLTVNEQSGLIRVDAGALDAELRGDNALAFKFYSPRVRLLLQAQPVEPRTTVVHHAEVVLTDEELRVQSALAYMIERTGIFELIVQLPAEFRVDQVQCEPLREFSVDPVSNRLTVSLRERTIGALSLQITGHRPLAAEMQAGEQPLPLLEPLGVERETGSILVFARDSVEVITGRDGLQGVQPLPASPQQRGDARLASAWSFTRRPVVIPVQTLRKPTRLSAQIASRIDVQPELTELHHRLEFLVEFAGIDTFHFQLPEAVSNRARIEVPAGSAVAIKQKTAAPAEAGWVTWTVVMQREVTGPQIFEINWQVPRGAAVAAADDAAADEGAPAAAPPAEQVFPLVRPLGISDAQGAEQTPLSKIYGEIQIDRERSLSLAASASGGGVEPIDVRELKLLGPSGLQGFRYYKLPDSGSPIVSILQQRFDIQDVVATVVSRGLVEIVTSDDAEASYRCRWLLKTTERQRLLVSLPVGVQLLGSFLNDREIKLELAEGAAAEKPDSGRQAYWVNVARPGSADEPFLLTFQYLVKVDPNLGDGALGRGKLQLPLPQLGGTSSGAVIQELKVVLWVPEAYTPVGNPRQFTLQPVRRTITDLVLGTRPEAEARELESWVSAGLSGGSGFLQLPTQGRRPFIYSNLGGADELRVTWWQRITMTGILSGALVLIGLILLRTPWENRLGMLLLGVFAAVLYGLKDSHALHAGLEAAQYGLYTLGGLWVLQGLLSAVGSTGVSSAAPAASNPAPAVPVASEAPSGGSNPGAAAPPAVEGALPPAVPPADAPAAGEHGAGNS
jgi:hypothetical protein